MAMARRTAKKGKGRGKKTAKRKPTKARRAKRSAPRKAGTAASRNAERERINALEAENARLREDLEKLRAELGERPPDEDEPRERTLPLDL
jgi:hypothetical protein